MSARQATRRGEVTTTDSTALDDSSETTQRAEVAGRFVTTFVEGAGEVSTVFRRVLRESFERHLGAVESEQWYEVPAVVDAFEALAEEAGPATMRKGGMECAKIVEFDSRVGDIAGALAALQTAHADAHHGPTAGNYTYDEPTERSVRVGITADYPYGADFAEGVLLQTVREFGPVDGVPVAERTAARDDEAAAWTLTW
jgi:hypothetical protein